MAHDGPAHAGFPPGPRTTLPLYYQLAMLLAPIALLRKLAQDYGDFVHYRSGRQHLYLCNHPDLVREVLVSQQRAMTKGLTITRAAELIGTGILTSEGAQHREQRRVAQPAFHQQRLDGYASTMVRCAADAAAGWQPGARLDVAREMMRLTLRIVGRAMFDPEFGDDEDVVVAALNEIMEQLDNAGFPLWSLRSRLPTRGNQRYRTRTAALDAAIDRMLAHAECAGGETLPAMMLAAHHPAVEDANSFRARLRREIRTLLIAGNLTVTTALSWSWYLLAQHPDVERALHAEVDRVLGGDPPTLASIPELRLTRMVMAETLRLYPPIWNLSRRATADCAIGGYHVPAGSLLLFSPYLIHRDPRWFPDPDRFEPARWEGEPARLKHAFFAFGTGPRGCIGEPFAWMEGVLVLATIARRWRLRRAPGPPIAPRAAATLRPKFGLPMIVEPRGRTS